jgi:hypothetical protein
MEVSGLLRIEHEADIIQLVQNDPWMMDILENARSLQLPDWWVCAGFVRSKIWDVIHNFEERTPLPDVDVIYYDDSNLQEETEKQWEARLRSLNPAVPWSVKNEARMHTVNQLPPYTSAVDAISKFPETATALGLSLDKSGKLILVAPHGISDVINVILRPSPYFVENLNLLPIYEERVIQKKWQATWKQLQISST